MRLFCAANLIARCVSVVVFCCGSLLYFDPDFTSKGISLGNGLLEVSDVA